MKVYSVTVFNSPKDDDLKCHTDIDNSIDYPAHLRINRSKESYTSGIDIYFSSLQDLVNFKNSFLSSFEKAMREAKDA